MVEKVAERGFDVGWVFELVHFGLSSKGRLGCLCVFVALVGMVV